jgi:N-acetylglucosaminyl-diphospho-decaprenol L-rhamnosyltransferase
MACRWRGAGQRADLHVAVAIVGFRNAEDIARCLSALSASTYADFEVVICENGGAESAAALSARLPRRLAGGQSVRVLDAGSNLGYAGGVNRAIAAAPDADAWWVLNPDTEADPGALAALVARVEVSDCDAAGCTIHFPDGMVQTYGGHWRPWLARAVSLGHGASLSAPVDAEAVERALSYLSGACMLVTRRFLEVAGPMREEYFLYCEEVEWCLRAQARGLRLGFAPEGRVLHRSGSTTGSSDAIRARPRMPIYLDERNKMLVTRDCFPRRLPVAAVSALGLAALRFLGRGARRQFGYAVAGWRDGLLNRRGAPLWVDAG